MTELDRDLSLAQARSLIDSYAFDLGRNCATKLLERWLDLYPASWIRLATIEALYLGRYKAVSVEQILSVWLRMGSPNAHFTYEFERLICRKLPKHLSELSNFTANDIEATVTDSPMLKAKAPVRTPTVDVEPLNLEKAFKNPEPSDNLSLISALGLSYKSNWSEFTEDNKTIHQFIPLPDVSSFFNKLKTFGEQRLESQ
jgi:hypothetical protein